MSYCDLCNLKKDSKPKLNVLELYSGIGGMHYGLINSGIEKLGFELNITAIDINLNANSVYKHNFNEKTKVLSKNIISLNALDLDKLNIDICTMSPPCQPFTRQGLQLDTKDSRTESLKHLLDLFPKMKKLPKYFFIENVKNFEDSDSCKLVLEMFNKLKFNFKQFLLQPFQFGIPNSRLRYYCIAKKEKFCFNDDSRIIIDYPKELSTNSCFNCLKNYFLEENLLKNSQELLNKLNEYSEFQKNSYKIDENYFSLKKIEEFLLNNLDYNNYFLKKNLLLKYFSAIDIIDKNSFNSCCFTSAYSTYLTGTGSFLNTDQSLTSDLIKELKEKLKNSNEITDIDLKIRKFTPKEIANLMGFPEKFNFPENLTDKQKYKLIGNSVNIVVISYIMKLLFLNEKL